MQQQPLAKWLFLFAALLLVSGAVERALHLSEQHLGLYLILGGLLVGLVLILHSMRQACEEEKEALKKQHQQLEKR